MKKRSNCAKAKKNRKIIRLLVGAVVLLVATLVITLIRMFVVKGV